MTIEQIESLPLSALRECPFNHRKRYDEDALHELAESIRQWGVMQPIVVRVLPKTESDLYFQYEIVFGHRRARAAAIAELDRVPAIIRELDDQQVAIAQVHENVKRRDVTPLEEADGYQHLRQVHGMKGEQIAAEVGKTKAYVYARLKLATAAPEIRTAVADEGLSPEIGLKIARFPHHDLQRMALKGVAAEAWQQTAGQPIIWRSVRDATSQLRSIFSTDLSKAPFDLADDELAKRAGACTSCPRRAGNIDGMEDALAPNICTDRSCYDVKLKEHVRLRVVDYKARGLTVHEGDAAKKLLPYAAWTVPQGYVALTQEAYKTTLFPGHEPTSVSYADAIRKAPEFASKVEGVVDPHTGRFVECMRWEDANELHHTLAPSEQDHDDESAEGADTPSPAAQGSGSAKRAALHGTAERDAMLASLTPAERVCFDRDAWPRVRDAVLWGISSTTRTTDDIRLILRYEFDMAGAFDDDVLEALGLNAKRAEAKAAAEEREEEFDEAGWPRDWIATATADELGTLMTGIAVSHELSDQPLYGVSEVSREIAAERVRLALSFGVDPADYAPRGDEPPAAGDEGDQHDGRPDEAGSAGEEAKDEPADAGVAIERDPNTSDMFNKETPDA